MSKSKSWFIRPNIHAPGTAYVVDEKAKEIAFCQTEADAERIYNVRESVFANDAVREALENLVNKLDAMAPRLDSALIIQAIHGMEYDGPNWCEEMKDARAALEASGREDGGARWK